MSELVLETAGQLAGAIRHGEISAIALVQFCADRIDALHPPSNAGVALRREEALDHAAAPQRVIVAGRRIGPLVGLPVGLRPLESQALSAASVRASFSDAGLPAELQIVGPHYRGDLMLQASDAYGQARSWSGR